MLVLTRGKDESIMVGQNVEVTIVDIRGNTVRLDIAAPKSISVHRREVFEDIHRGKTIKAKEDKVL
jgi:carbon storage regulator